MVAVGEEQLHVMERGEGQVVLMIHGNPTWGYLWRKVALALPEAGYRCVMPDLVGLGLSSKPRLLSAHSLDAHAAWLGDLVQQLDLRDVILVVQDWGGAIGSLAFSEQEHRLAGLVVLNTVLMPPREGFKPTAFHRFAQAPVLSDVAFRLLGFPQNRLHGVQGDPSSIQGTTARAYRYPLRRLLDRAAPLALARMVPDRLDHPSIPALERCRDLVTRFHGPTEIVWGRRDPILGRVLGAIKRMLPQAGVTETDAGHFLQEEVPDAIAAAVERVAQRTRPPSR